MVDSDLLGAIIEHANDIVILTRAEPLDEPGPVITYVNPAFTRLTGYRREEALGQTPRILQGPDTDRATLDRIRAALERAEPVREEVLNYDRDGRSYWLDMQIMPLRDTHGRVTHFAAIERDLTEKRRAEELKAEFVSTVSHELRTPLTSISGALRLLEAGAVSPLSDAGSELLSLATRNCDRLQTLIDDLLDMQKIVAGKFEFAEERIDLGELVRAGVAQQQPFAARHRVQFDCRLSAEKLVVRGDANRLLQVLANLLSNAAKFAPADSVVTIEVRRADPSTARVTVADRGPGIPPEFHAHVFEPFTQAVDNELGGTGLGLSIASALVEHHGGVIGFHANRPVGTVFYVDLPLVG